MATRDAIRQSQAEKISLGDGIIAALDQSGGSIQTALRLYGVIEAMYGSEHEMVEEMHAMRARIITSPAFTSEHVIGAIIFRESLTRKINDKPIPRMLWEDRGIVPFLKIDDGLGDRCNDVQLLKQIPDLAGRLGLAQDAGIFGTKMRTVIHEANDVGIKEIVDQQFQVGGEILDAGLIPILEPEVSIVSGSKAKAETLLAVSLERQLNVLSDGQQVVLKLSIPTLDGLYDALANHPRVLRVAALSGGYTQDEACTRLARQDRMIPSFSRALLEGLSKKQSEAEFNEVLSSTIKRLKALRTPKPPA